MDDASFTLVMALIMLVVMALFVFIAVTQFRVFRRNSTLLKRKSEMMGNVTGQISSVEQVRRRNRSFRWTNEIPTVSYVVNGVKYDVEIDAAEARAGAYQVGKPCTVHYVLSEPDCCLVEEFEKKIKSQKNGALVATLLLAFFSCNIFFSVLGSLIAVLLG